MAAPTETRFTELSAPTAGTAVLLTDGALALGGIAKRLDEAAGGSFERAARIAKFEGKERKTLELLAPSGLGLDRLIYVGLGEAAKVKPRDWLRYGGVIGAAAPEGETTVVLERPDGAPADPESAAYLALGIAMGAYSFDRYKTGDKDKKQPKRIAIAVGDVGAAERAWARHAAVREGVTLARDLVNEPANVLGPVEFATRLQALAEHGVDVEVLEEHAIREAGMNALQGVAQGSDRPPRVVIMRWSGREDDDKPVAFLGKGVVFDTGGISIKPAAGMEDMKGDMGGAAAVSGLMLALALRKAKVNAIGIVGLVENMPDGKAQRPGDVVTSLSGKTIEVVNTDAEGRLVLADLLTYAQRRMQPQAIIDLATLTGAIIVALGNHYAGLFSNDDALAGALTRAGDASGEQVWRMPLSADYDKLIDSKVADMKNIGGRYGGAVTAAQFLKRFVENDTPWAHLDIAGTAMGSPATDTNKSWGSGFGVRLLDEYVRERFEGGDVSA